MKTDAAYRAAISETEHCRSCENGWQFATPGGWVPCASCGGTMQVPTEAAKQAFRNRIRSGVRRG